MAICCNRRVCVNSTLHTYLFLFGPVLEVTTCYLQGKYGVEIRIMSVNEDNSHSWVRISHGSNKFVTNFNNNEELINKDHSHSWVRISHGLNKLVTNMNNKDQDDNEQETSEMQFEECA